MFPLFQRGEKSAIRLLTMLVVEIQSIVCIITIQTCKSCNIITYRDFNSAEARKCWFPRRLVDVVGG